MIESKDYGTATIAARKAGINRTRLDEAMKRRDEKLEVEELCGGQLIVSIKSAKAFAKRPPKRGRPTKSEPNRTRNV